MLRYVKIIDVGGDDRALFIDAKPEITNEEIHKWITTVWITLREARWEDHDPPEKVRVSDWCPDFTLVRTASGLKKVTRKKSRKTHDRESR